jgi:60 kDa SS-A/Ro ribonucleoprotein
MSDALKRINTKVTPQTQRANSHQVRNNAGGYVYEASSKSRLERFLILGVDGGTYYVKTPDLTAQNVDFIRTQLQENASEVIATVVDVSHTARAKSNSPALFVLALAMNTDGVDKTLVSDAVQKVARTSTHLFEYMQYLENLGGWGRAKRNSVAQWYSSKDDQQLGYQLVKYRQRDGWTHRDALRLSHPRGLSNGLVNFALGKQYFVNEVPSIVIGFDKVQAATTETQVVSLIREYGLPWEAVPTQWHKSLKVWRAIFEQGMGQTALLRNVTRFAKLGAFDDVVFAREYANKLADQEAIYKGRLHPINYLNAAVVYEEGQFDRNSRNRGWGSTAYRVKTWDVNSKVLTALNDGFDLSFKNVVPSNKRTLIAVDTSASMWWGPGVGLELLHAEIAAAVGIFVARTEPYSQFSAFSTHMVDTKITEKDSLATVVNKMRRAGGGGTDLSQPMLWAKSESRDFDTFVMITDNETWAGRIHPDQALKQYRQAIGHDAKLAVLATEATPFTIANPDDPKGQMDFVGFDASGPRVLADFSAGRL